ncbi:MAG: hypothetical protein ABIA63_15465, partial [bacterium]
MNFKFYTIIVMLLVAMQGMLANSRAQEKDAADVDISATKEAEENAANQEAGAYERKSVSYIDALWLMDPTLKGLKSEHVAYVLEEIKKKIHMSRFDFNPLPEALISDFVAKANALKQITPDTLAMLMDETIVPKILSVVDMQKEARAANLLTEQQKNSFFSDKVKELGITAVELEKVMNSAFIYIPFAGKYAKITNKKTKRITTSLQTGILWYRISTKGEKPKAKLVVKKASMSLGFAKEGKSYIGKGGLLNADVFSFRSMVKNCARNLLVATQEMPEFRLSSQVTEVDGGKVGFPLGKTEGLWVDDKYKIVEFMEDDEGSVKQEENGWVIVKSVADSNSKEGYKSKAFKVAGDPMEGVIISEFPRIPIDILLKFKRFPYSNATENFSGTYIDSLEVSGGYGLQIDAQYNIGRYIGINQLFFDFGFGLGWGGAKGKAIVLGSGTSELKSVSNTCFDFSLLKKFYIGRMALMIQPVFGIQSVAVDAGEIPGLLTTYYYELRNSGAGIAINTGAEYALTPAMNLGLGLGYQLYGKSKEWDFYGKAGTTGDWADLGYTLNNEVELDHSGLSIQLY